MMENEENESAEYEERLAQSYKTVNQISKLKENIDNLASSLKVYINTKKNSICIILTIIIRHWK